MTPFASNPDVTLAIVTYASDDRIREARRHAAVRRAARRRRRGTVRTTH